MRKLLTSAIVLGSLLLPASAQANVRDARCTSLWSNVRNITAHAYFNYSISRTFSMCRVWVYPMLRKLSSGRAEDVRCTRTDFPGGHRIRCVQAAGAAPGSCHGGPACEWLVLTVRFTVLDIR
jgi:hypothetical protein